MPNVNTPTTLRSPQGMSGDSAKSAKKKKRGVASPRDTLSTSAGSGGPRDAGPSGGAGSPAVTSPRDGNAPPLAASPSLRPNSAFGQQYIGAMYPNAFQNPEVLAGNWMGSQGITPQGGGGMWSVYNDLAREMPQLFYLTQGMGGNADALSYASFLDYAGQFLNQYSTPGGGTIAPSAVLNLLGAGGDSQLGMILNNPDLDPEQQAGLLLSMMESVLSTSLTPLAASAAMGNANASAQQWADQKYQGRGGTFQEFLNSSGLMDMFR